MLALWYPRTQATNIAARIGQALAFVFGFLGLMGNPLLIFIAIFVYLAATAEAQSVGLQDVSRSLGVARRHDHALRDARAAGDDRRRRRALLRTTQHEFPVVDGGGRLRGILTRNAMVQALSKTGPRDAGPRSDDRRHPDRARRSRLEAALKLMQGRGAPAVGVLDAEGRLVGYITPENIGELMMVETAGRGARPRRATGPLLPQ